MSGQSLKKPHLVGSEFRRGRAGSRPLIKVRQDVADRRAVGHHQGEH